MSFVVNAKHDVLYLGAVERGTQPPWSGESSPAAKAAAQRDVYEACESLIAEETQCTVCFCCAADFVVVAQVHKKSCERSAVKWRPARVQTRPAEVS